MKKSIIGFAIPVIALAAGAAVWFTGPCCQKGFTVTHREELAIEKESKAKIKGATEYYNSLRADLNTGKIDYEGVLAVKAQLAKRSASKAKMGSWLTWKEMGPDNIGGRTRGIVIDKDNNNVLYAGGVSGGFWKSTNGGGTWRRAGDISDDSKEENINISHIVQAANGDLYYSTGEGGYTVSDAEGNSGFHGGGVFKSTDRGETFQLLTATKVTGTVSPWRNVHRLAADPYDHNRIYAGTESGWWMSDNAGQTFSKCPIVASVPQGKDMVISPDGNTVFAVLGSFSAFQVWRSTDRAKTFTRVGTTTIASGSSSFVIAMARTNPEIIYLSSARPQDGTARSASLDKVYRSEDNGTTWEVIGTGGTFFNPLANQGQYDHCITVDPRNENRIFIGGLNIWEGRQIGGTFQWGQLSNWSTEFFVDNSRNPYYVHADQHILVFDRNPTNPVLYVGSDGGVSKSVDITYTNTPTFFNSDYGYSTVQFYGIAVSAYDKMEVIGGTQDNGILLVNKEGITLLNADKIRAGDGGFCEISKINPDVYFGEYIYGDLYRSFNKGKNWSNFVDANVPATGQPRYPFISIFSLWESFNDPNSPDTSIHINTEKNYNAGDAIEVRSRTGYMMKVTLTAPLAKGDTLHVKDVVQSRFFMGAYGSIWVSRDAINPGGQPVFFKLADLPGFVPHDIKHSQDGNTVYVSGEEGITGVVYRITNVSGKKFEYTSTGTFDAADYGIETKKIFSHNGQAATGIGVDENDAAHIIVSLGGYGKPSHVYRTKNALDETPVFSDVSGNLPDFPVYDALINMKNSNEYLIAGEYGVWSSRTGGMTWNEENEGMERVPAFMLRQVKFEDKPWGGPVFYVGTHGRGVFMSETLATGIEETKKKGGSSVLNLTMYPNPATDITNVILTLDKATQVTIRVFDMQGKVLRTENHTMQAAGERSYKVNTTGLRQGTYLVNVTAGEKIHTGKLLITR